MVEASRYRGIFHQPFGYLVRVIARSTNKSWQTLASKRALHVSFLHEWCCQGGALFIKSICHECVSISIQHLDHFISFFLPKWICLSIWNTLKKFQTEGNIYLPQKLQSCAMLKLSKGHGASMQADIASGILPYIRCHGLAYGFLVLSKLDVINVQLA